MSPLYDFYTQEDKRHFMRESMTWEDAVSYALRYRLFFEPAVQTEEKG